MYNLKIIESPGRIEIYKINKYVVNESKKHEGYKIVERMLKDNEELADVINENKDEVKKDNRKNCWNHLGWYNSEKTGGGKYKTIERIDV